MKVNFRGPSGSPSSVTLPDPVVRLWADLLFGGLDSTKAFKELSATVSDLAIISPSERKHFPTFAAFVLAHLVADIRSFCRDELGADLKDLFPTKPGF